MGSVQGKETRHAGGFRSEEKASSSQAKPATANGTAIYYEGFKAPEAKAAGNAKWDEAPVCTHDPKKFGSQIDASGR
eukprot:479830-Pelagomonas_calceolata.AAC.2